MNAPAIALPQEKPAGRPRVAGWAVVRIGAAGALLLSKADFERALEQSFAQASVKAHCAYSRVFPCTLFATRVP